MLHRAQNSHVILSSPPLRPRPSLRWISPPSSWSTAAGRLARLLPRPDQRTLWASSIPLRAERRRATRLRLNPLRNSDDGDGKSGGNWIGGTEGGTRRRQDSPLRGIRACCSSIAPRAQIMMHTCFISETPPLRSHLLTGIFFPVSDNIHTV